MADTNLKVHHLKPAPGAHKKKIRVGRGEGGKRGKTAGRGTKGTSARYQVPVGFEGGQTPMHMRLPKLRGFKNRNRVEFQVVNVAQLSALFPDGGTIGVSELVAAGAVRKGELVKVLGNGDLSVKIDITADAFSASARDKITAAGGTFTQL
jgi:large subunit ribosomal protein L15